MNVLLSTLKEELKTVKKLELKYLKKIQALPKGSFIIRKIRNQSYGYLTRREGEQVKQEYLGSLSKEAVQKYKEIIQKRREYQAQLKSVREQIKLLTKVLRGKTK